MRELSPIQAARNLDEIVRLLNDFDIPYIVIGGLALSVWGKPRTTLDIDFLVMANEVDLKRFSKKASTHGIKIDRKWSKWNPLLRGQQIRFRKGELLIDILTPRDEHDRQAILRKKKKRLRGRLYNFISAEDFILQKIKVGRPRDFEDAVSVLEEMRGKLNLSYLKRWARRLGVLSELNYINNL